MPSKGSSTAMLRATLFTCLVACSGPASVAPTPRPTTPAVVAAPPDAAALDAAPAATPLDAVTVAAVPDTAPVAAPTWQLIDAGFANHQVQPCAAPAQFASLASVLKRSVGGEVTVRGRAWQPATFPCTDNLVESCEAMPVLADARPTDESERGQIALSGYLAPNLSLSCVGAPTQLACPIPLGGAEYGVTGTLVLSGDADTRYRTIQVTRLCRLTRRP